MKQSTSETQRRARKRTAKGRSLKRVVSRLLDDIPTSWLDSLLTGTDAALHGDGGTWGCPDIERLLQGIKERMTKTANDPSSPTAGGGSGGKK